MSYKLNLPDVSSKYGAPMGRSNWLPEDRNQPYLMHLTRVRLVDGGYDTGGAYWGASSIRELDPNLNGQTSYNPLYCAECDDGEIMIRLFVRPLVNWFAESDEWREAAKQEVRKKLPNARFYR